MDISKELNEILNLPYQEVGFLNTLIGLMFITTTKNIMTDADIDNIDMGEVYVILERDNLDVVCDVYQNKKNAFNFIRQEKIKLKNNFHFIGYVTDTTRSKNFSSRVKMLPSDSAISALVQ